MIVFNENRKNQQPAFRTDHWEMKEKEQSSLTVQEPSSFCIAGKTGGGWPYRGEHSGKQWARRGERVFSGDE